MGKLLQGTAAGTSENDPGAQGSTAGGLSASESEVVAASEAYSPGKAKETGFQNVQGTSPTGDTK